MTNTTVVAPSVRVRRALRAAAAKWVAPMVRKAFGSVGVHLVRSPFSRFQLELYDQSPRGEPRYVNLGAGSFRHPRWHNVDMPNAFYGATQQIHIAHDFTSEQPLPFASGTVEVFYCSHVIEHLSDEADQRLFSDVYRCLKPGGICRFTCPDMTHPYNALMRRDGWFWRQPSGWGTYQADIEQCFLEYIATLLTLSPKPLPSSEVWRLAHSMPMEQLFDTLCGLLPRDANTQMPEGHCNWFTPAKLIRMMKAAGATQVWESRYLQSVETKLREPRLFDFVCPQDSLYVECRKPSAAQEDIR